MIADRNTIKSWFQRGMKPLATQFAAWIDSFWHKTDTIPTASIDGLETTLNKKAEQTDVNNLYADFIIHRADEAKHKTEAEQGKLNNLAANPNATYATRAELEQLSGNSIIIIPADFTKPYNDMEAEIIQAVQVRLEDGTLFNKPVYLLYCWKEDYTNADAPVYYSLVPRSDETWGGFLGGKLISMAFNCSIVVASADAPEYAEALCLTVQIRTSNNSVKLMYGSYIDKNMLENVYLTEDENGILNSRDKNWNQLYNELKKNNHPQVSLKTPSSGMYCPASYDFTVNDAAAAIPLYSGTMVISYVKETDGVQELWVETRTFLDFMGSNGSYDYNSYLKKYPLSDVMQVSRIQIVDTLPSGEELQDGDIIILTQA